MDQAGDQAGSAFHAHTMSVFLFDCERHALSSHVLSSKAWPTGRSGTGIDRRMLPNRNVKICCHNTPFSSAECHGGLSMGH